jgi:hypothetical protein
MTPQNVNRNLTNLIAIQDVSVIIRFPIGVTPHDDLILLGSDMRGQGFWLVPITIKGAEASHMLRHINISSTAIDV